MKKKLVAVAVAGVLGAPLAAHAQTANVILYGRLNIDFELVKGKQADGSNPTVTRLSSNSSRFGLRGTESLGGGLDVIFQIESSINGDTNAGNLGGDFTRSRALDRTQGFTRNDQTTRIGQNQTTNTTLNTINNGLK